MTRWLGRIAAVLMLTAAVYAIAALIELIPHR